LPSLSAQDGPVYVAVDVKTPSVHKAAVVSDMSVWQVPKLPTQSSASHVEHSIPDVKTLGGGHVAAVVSSVGVMQVPALLLHSVSDVVGRSRTPSPQVGVLNTAVE